MNTCSCGILLDDKHTQCPRCAALHVLGLEMDATENEIRKAHRLLVKVWGAENFSGDQKLREAAAEKLKEADSAFDLITATSTERGPWHPPTYSSTYEAPQELPPSAVPAPMQIIDDPAPSVFPAPIPHHQFRQTMQALYRFWRKFKLALKILAIVFVLLTGRTIWTALKEQYSRGGPEAVIKGSGRQEAPPAETPAVQAAQQNAKRTQPHQTAAAPGKSLTYITVGSSKDEVLAQQGTPTAASEDKLVYGKSELYLKDGRVTGWRIDPASSPLHVKLWPSSAAGLRQAHYEVGSSKDVVLAVQGTPTAFTEETFEYGRSQVYFRNDKVVGWKEDPSSVILWVR
jgi:hypothetical protein